MARSARRLTPPTRPRRNAWHHGLQAGATLTLALAAVTAGGGLLAGCSGSQAAGLAREACRLVAKAGQLRAAARSGSGGSAAALDAEADRQLVLAEPAAAQAAGLDPTWQALSANLLEVGRLPTSLVMPALRADCSNAGVHVP